MWKVGLDLLVLFNKLLFWFICSYFFLAYEYSSLIILMFSRILFIVQIYPNQMNLMIFVYFETTIKFIEICVLRFNKLNDLNVWKKFLKNSKKLSKMDIVQWWVFDKFTNINLTMIYFSWIFKNFELESKLQIWKMFSRFILLFLNISISSCTKVMKITIFF